MIEVLNEASPKRGEILVYDCLPKVFEDLTYTFELDEENVGAFKKNTANIELYIQKLSLEQCMANFFGREEKSILFILNLKI